MPSTGGHNWEKGKRGFRPKLTHAQSQELMLFWQPTNWNTKKGREYMLETFGVEMSNKGLYDLKQKLIDWWKNRNEKLDEEVDWNSLVALQVLCDIPPQATELRTTLHDIWDAIQWRLLTKTPPVPDPLGPSYRTIRWWVHMEYHKAKVEGIIDRLVIASQYTVRDLLADCEGTDIDRDDIDKWLVLEPWSSREKMEIYLRLVREKTIKPLREHTVREKAEDAIENHLADHWSDAIYGQDNMFLNQGNRLDKEVAPHGEIVDQLFDYEGAWKFLLPSQRINKKTLEAWKESL